MSESSERAVTYPWRMSAEDYAKLNDAAASHGVPLVTYLERTVLGRPDAQPKRPGRRPKTHREVSPKT